MPKEHNYNELKEFMENRKKKAETIIKEEGFTDQENRKRQSMTFENPLAYMDEWSITKPIIGGINGDS